MLNATFLDDFQTLKLRSNSVTRQVTFNTGTLVENAKIKKIKCNILSGQKLIKNAKNGQFGYFFENLKLAIKQCYQTGHF